MKRRLFSAIGLAGVLLLPLGVGGDAWAQESETELAKNPQNPVANLISIPLQNRMDSGIGPINRMQNVQPIVPISLNSEWNLITRTIMPIIKQPDVNTTNDNTWGIGSTTFTVLLSPANPGPVILADWQATPGNKWMLPVGGGFGKIQRIGKFPFNLLLAAYSNAVRPDPRADWELRP